MSGNRVVEGHKSPHLSKPLEAGRRSRVGRRQPPLQDPASLILIHVIDPSEVGRVRVDGRRARRARQRHALQPATLDINHVYVRAPAPLRLDLQRRSLLHEHGRDGRVSQ